MNSIRIGDIITVTYPMGVTREVTIIETAKRSVLVTYPLPRGKGDRRFWVERDRLSEHDLTADERLLIVSVYAALTANPKASRSD